MAQRPCRLLVRGGAFSPLIKVPSSACTVLEVKLQIEAELGVRVARQTLWSFEEGEKMEDSKKIGDYSIDNYLIRLKVQPPYEDVTHEIKVFSTNNVEHKLVVKQTETVLDLKKKMEGKLGAKAEEMKLFVKDYVDEMKNDEPLYRYYIRDGIKILATITKKARETSEDASKNTETDMSSPSSKDRDTSYCPSTNTDTEISSKDGEASYDPSTNSDTHETSSTSSGSTYWY